MLTHRKVTMEVTPMTFITAEMKPVSVGRFLISCQIFAHRHGKKKSLDLLRSFFLIAFTVLMIKL